MRGGQLCDFIANISGLEKDIVDRKMALQTAITPIYASQISTQLNSSLLKMVAEWLKEYST